MAALPYMQFYVADYLADTMHLTTEEHGAYLMLIMNYWQTGKPIKKTRLQAITRVPNERWSDVERTLSEFFYDDADHWQHSRIEADLMIVEEAQEQRSRAGKASAESRKREKQANNKRKSNARSTPVERDAQRNANENATNKEEKRIDTDKTRIETEEKKQIPRKRDVFVPPDWVPDGLWSDYVKSRRSMKKHPMSASALTLTIEAIQKTVAAGHPVESVLSVMTANGWRSVKPDWMNNEHGDKGKSGVNTHGGFTPDRYEIEDVARKFKVVGGEK